ncbi:class I SAM-dependent methyltransferase [Actinomadura keratinilytica]|jgi:SAM-dependent methyltransferase|uniref:Methyltransferase type 11 domain-containing protein n=1 Tax=Actinomadura keratinilytica TaxID=547461 RepID=A0ABP6ULA6_9ACTN
MPPKSSNGSNPFTDPHTVPALYADRVRVQRRSNALLTAKIRGAHVGNMVADLLTRQSPHLTDHPAPLIADLGCGTGRPTRVIAQRFPRARLLAVDASPTMLDAARHHLATSLPRNRHTPDKAQVGYLQADFHSLPLAAASCDAVTAVFSLYHAPAPAHVLAEIARCLRPGSVAVLVTKSADSYHQLDHLLTVTGLDSGATTRPSLYAAADSRRLPALCSNVLTVEAVLHDQHVFLFRDAAHLADYLVTVPKYQLPPPLDTDPTKLAEQLRRRRGNAPLTATSTITYVIARRPS